MLCFMAGAGLKIKPGDSNGVVNIRPHWLNYCQNRLYFILGEKTLMCWGYYEHVGWIIGYVWHRDSKFNQAFRCLMPWKQTGIEIYYRLWSSMKHFITFQLIVLVLWTTTLLFGLLSMLLDFSLWHLHGTSKIKLVTNWWISGGDAFSC